MIPGFVGKNISAWLKENDLPKTVSAFGTTPEQIFVTYHDLKERYGKRMEQMPLGAVGVYTFVDKLRVGLTQLMAGARSFRLDTLSRSDVVSLTEEAAKVSGIPYIMDAYREEAMEIINS
jgi:hypothetical protein